MAAMNSVHLRNIQKVVNSFIFRPCLLSNKCRAVSRYSTESSDVPYTERNEAEIAKIEKKRNKSGLPDEIRNLMIEHQKLPKLVFKYQLTTRYRRSLYGKFGRASGVDPSIMWPTKEELGEIIENEKEFCPTLEEMLERTRERRIHEEQSKRNREASVEYNMSKLDKWLEDLKQRRDKKLAEVQAQKDKKEELVEEVRQYFGYRLSPKDPKFVEILEKKENEEKKLAKEAKKKEKFARDMARLASLAQTGTVTTEAGEKAPKNSNKASKSTSRDENN